MVYRYDRKDDSITAVAPDGDEVVESVSRSLVARLTRQGVPDVLWRGSPSIDLPTLPMFSSLVGW